MLNIGGLALGMAAFMFIIQYVAYENGYDTFHVNHKNLYRITYTNTLLKDGTSKNSATAPPRIAPFMKEMMPEVKGFTRVKHYPGLVVSHNGVKFREDDVLMVDPDFLKIFTFPMLSGDPKTALNEIRTIVISETTAKKYFNDQSPLGQTIAIDGNEDFKVTGVIKDAPANSHLKFDFLISYETIKWWSEGEAETSWWSNEYYQYVLLHPNTKAQAFVKRFQKLFVRERGKVNQAVGQKQEFQLQPITDVHLHSKMDQELNPDQQGDGESVHFLTLIAFFILLIACINYINLFTARAIERAKEVGVRKTVGARRFELIGQFMIEAFVMGFLSLFLSIGIVSLGLSYFNVLTSSSLTLSFLTEPDFWKNLIACFMLGTFTAGLYPAFALSSYRPSTVLKGKFSAFGSAIMIRRSLVVFQFAASVIMIAGTMLVYLQLHHMRTADIGFDMSHVMVVRGPGVTEDELTPAYQAHTAAFINTLLNYTEIKAATGGSFVPGKEIQEGILVRQRDDVNSEYKFVQNAWINYEYFETLDIRFLAGRDFRRGLSGDTACAILNESAVYALGFTSVEDAIGRTISLNGGQMFTLIGVAENFNQMSVHRDVKPIFFSLYAMYSPFYLVRFEKGTQSSVIEKVRSEYVKVHTRDPFDYFFLDEFFNLQYHKEQRFSRVFILFAIFAVIVSCLGLFGLSSFMTLQRAKEIGIRKVLGANLFVISYLLTKEFIILVGIANIVAWPFIYYIMDSWLSNFTIRVSIGPSVFLASGFIVLLIAVLTVGLKTVMAAKTNPVNALRND